MTNEMEFEMLLDSVVRERANVGLPPGFEERIVVAARTAAASPVAEVLVLAGGLLGESIFTSLWNGVRDRVWPRRLPELVLESRPVAVRDPMAGEGGYSSTAYAVAVHAMAVLLIGFVVRAQIRGAGPVHGSVVVVDPVLRTLAKSTGGGGGRPGATPESKGHLPKAVEEQVVPPMQPPRIEARIPVEPTVVMDREVKLSDNVMPNVGMPNSPLAGVSLGNGRGTGIGPGDGSGVGPGSGGGAGGGLRQVGRGVSKPELIYSVEPEFSEEARKAKASGDVLVYLWVDERGMPTHVRVAHGMGMGLDEKALEAVKQYRFKPSMENGHPVAVEIYVNVNFQIF